MSCYYPLFGLPHGLHSSVTFSSHTLNQRIALGSTPRQHHLDLALYGNGDGGWRLRDRRPVPRPGGLVLDSRTYGLAPGDLLVCVPVPREQSLAAFSEQLPAPASKRIDRAPVAERCSLAFGWRGIESAYQGEYPLRMAELGSGTFFSGNPLLAADPAVGTNLVVLVSITRRDDPTLTSVELFEAGGRRLLRRIPHRRNRCTVIEVPPALVSTGELFLRCTQTVAIPIFLSLSSPDRPASMSVEHTHPPTELFWERDRLAGSRRIKATWLGARLR